MPALSELDGLVVVLVRARNPLNIGAAARAMSNFGVSGLRLVNPYEVAFREARSAVKAQAVLEHAREYGTLAARYVREFDTKWLRGDTNDTEPLIGSPDVQSLADMGNSYSVVSSMRSIPITREIIIRFAVATLLPVAPLMLTLMPLEAMLTKLVSIIL